MEEDGHTVICALREGEYLTLIVSQLEIGAQSHYECYGVMELTL